ncbi:hypothetical protein SDC9_210012 [bioreactor metagenome]|uniref:Uncharacterized protein n=1 Tax=bioreactor metagenome TaxID=1076179 RepID=A0A645JEZ3_9ZZZZ
MFVRPLFSQQTRNVHPGRDKLHIKTLCKTPDPVKAELREPGIESGGKQLELYRGTPAQGGQQSQHYHGVAAAGNTD